MFFMRKMIAMLLVVFVAGISAVDFEFDGSINYDKPYLFVSLGCNCWQAQALRGKAYSLRDAAFPFDWLVTLDTDLLIKCLDEKFKNFCEESCFIRYGDTHVENTYYNFKFTHDWPYGVLPDTKERYKRQLEFIKKKYERRIARFDSLRAFKGKVFFMRCFQVDPHFKGESGWNAQNALNLNNALKRFFPELNFTLVVVSCTEKTVPEIGNIDAEFMPQI
jgi:hypothetical protein